jgi:hypothetical protein
MAAKDEERVGKMAAKRVEDLNETIAFVSPFDRVGNPLRSL